MTPNIDLRNLLVSGKKLDVVEYLLQQEAPVNSKDEVWAIPITLAH